MQWIISSFMGRRRANKSRRRRHGMGQGIWESQRRQRNDIKLAPFVSLIENSFGEFFEVRNSEPLHSGDTLARNWTREWTLDWRQDRHDNKRIIRLNYIYSLRLALLVVFHQFVLSSAEADEWINPFLLVYKHGQEYDLGCLWALGSH